jgi:hypothetical protein
MSMRRIRKRLPSPAMLVALIALFSSLGGVSYGLAKGAINGREVKNKSLSGQDFRGNSVGGRVIEESDLGPVPVASLAGQAGGLTHFAAVSAEGVPLQRRGVLSAFKQGDDGDYQVVFDKVITSCVFTATIASETAVSSALRGQIGVGHAATDQRAVVVQTTNAAGAPAKRPFHVAVFC